MFYISLFCDKSLLHISDCALSSLVVDIPKSNSLKTLLAQLSIHHLLILRYAYDQK